jgi:hypothetical protein
VLDLFDQMTALERDLARLCLCAVRSFGLVALFKLVE